MRSLLPSLTLCSLLFASFTSQATVLVYTDKSLWLDHASIASSQDAEPGHSHENNFDFSDGYIMNTNATGGATTAILDGSAPPFDTTSPNGSMYHGGQLVGAGSAIDFYFSDLDYETFAFGGDWNVLQSLQLSLTVNGTTIDVISTLAGSHGNLQSGFLGIITSSSTALTATLNGLGLMGFDNGIIYADYNGVSSQDLAAVPVPTAGWLFISALVGLVGKKQLSRR